MDTAFRDGLHLQRDADFWLIVDLKNVTNLTPHCGNSAGIGQGSPGRAASDAGGGTESGGKENKP